MNKPEFTKEAIRADAKVIFPGVFMVVNKPKIGSLVNCGLFIFVTPDARARWPALESNPETFTKFMGTLGIEAEATSVVTESSTLSVTKMA